MPLGNQLIHVGPEPAPPQNVSITQDFGGYTISWKPPLSSKPPIASYDIEIKAGETWKSLKKTIVNATSYTCKQLNLRDSTNLTSWLSNYSVTEISVFYHSHEADTR